MADKVNRRIEVNVSKTINLGNFESVRAGAVLSLNIPDKVDAEKEFESLWETAEEQVDAYLSQYESQEEETQEEETQEEETQEEETQVETETGEEVETQEEVETEEEELDITEEDINKMTKPELVELCKTTEGMEDVNLKLNLGPLRATILDLLFEDEGEEVAEGEVDETGGSWDDDDWEDSK